MQTTSICTTRKTEKKHWCVFFSTIFVPIHHKSIKPSMCRFLSNLNQEQKWVQDASFILNSIDIDIGIGITILQCVAFFVFQSCAQRAHTPLPHRIYLECIVVDGAIFHDIVINYDRFVASHIDETSF